ncbi:MAG TPA: acyl-CoA dehydrogenase [Kangiella sp.]
MNIKELPHFQLAQELEAKLGDPNNPETLMSFKRIMELDESESFQEEFFQFLLSLKLHHKYVPQSLGGELHSYEEIYELGRVLARRDLSTAVTMSTLIWSLIAWVGGDEKLKKRCAEITLSNNCSPCLAYSEEDHGSDLLANGLTATKTEDGYILEGEKWPINRAARSDTVMLLARTSNDKGARNLSLFMVEKCKLDPSTFSYLPKVKSYGLRGCDICGIKFKGTEISKDSLIGREGDGLEIAIKAFQVTRTLCATLSIGALENNLRVVMDFAQKRQLYKKSVFDIPNAKRYLTGAFVDILTTDTVGSTLIRAAHVIPEQLSILSAVAKCFAPLKLDKSQKDLATVLGARFFFRERHKEGIFQKSLRDSQVVSLFDGSSEVNLYSLSTQLPLLARRQKKVLEKKIPVNNELLSQLFRASEKVPAFDGGKLDLSSHSKDLIMESIVDIPEKLAQISDVSSIQSIRLLVDKLLEKYQANLNRVMGNTGYKIGLQSPEMFNLSRQYCITHAAVCAINYWLYNRDLSDQYIADGEWLIVALDRLLHELHEGTQDNLNPYYDNAAKELERRTNQHLTYSLVSLPILPLINNNINNTEEHVA